MSQTVPSRLDVLTATPNPSNSLPPVQSLRGDGEASPRGKGASSTPRKGLVWAALVFVVVAVLGLGAWGLKHWVWPSSGVGDDVVGVVTRIDLPIVVTERGSLESARTIIA